MARAKPGKSETLTIRLDPKTRFMLEFVSRLRGQTITTVVERAIAAAADGAKIENRDPFSTEVEYTSWRNFWDISDGVRAIRIAGEPDLHPSYEEDRRLAFVKRHADFFYAIPDKLTGFRHAFIDILWPRIDEFIEIDEANKSTDYFAAGKAMREALLGANVKAPDWPRTPPPPKTEGRRPTPNAPNFTGPAAGGLDDDIPF